MTDIQALAAPFRRSSRDDWQRLVEKALKGASLDSLQSETREGITIAPLYRQAGDARPLFAGPAQEGAWQIVQRLDHPDPAEANAQARRELERGATGLALVPEAAPTAEGFGLSLGDNGLGQALEGVAFDRTHLRIEPHSEGAETALQLADIVEDRGLDPVGADIAFGLDLVGVAAREGGLVGDWAQTEAAHAEVTEQLVERGFRGPFLEADGRVYAAAGADAVHELAAVLASAAQYLRLLERAGAPLEEAFPRIGVTLTVDADQLVSIAKLRAARLLWARMQELCAAPASPLRLHAETARLMMMRADPHTNLLRTTIAAFAAGAAGADSIAVLPFTAAIGLPDALARRLARNTQLLLMQESHLHRVADPSAGSGAAEALTHELCRRAWDAFREIERDGGIVESLAEGRLQKRIAAQREALIESFAEGNAGMVGVTHYVGTTTVPVKVAELPPREAPPRRRPAVAFEPLLPLNLEGHVSRVPESAP